MIDLTNEAAIRDAYVHAAFAGMMSTVVQIMRSYPDGLEQLRDRCAENGMSHQRFNAALLMKGTITVREIATICLAAGVWPSIELT